ncbi:MAG TPA: protein kinase, partial [Byssovorax sp.]
MDLRSGAVIAGRYRVDRKVGAGGMGEVWSGEHLAIGSRIALKTMLPAAALNHEVVARFKREAFLLGKVRSDYVARVVDFVADDAHGLVLVMEFVEGQSLARLLTERILTVEETVELGFDLANALTDLHRSHIVHRDLKPGNVILSRTPDGGSRAVLVDFGVSRLLNPTEKDEETITGITRADMAVGTIEYMSPEQILNSRSVTAASDIYAVGAILYRAVCGRHVFGDVQSETELAQLKLTTEGAPLSLPGRADRLALGLRDAVTRALKRRPSERIKTAEELLAAFTPLRDLVRVNALDLDSTTEDVHENFLEPTTKKPRDSLVSISEVGPMPLPAHPSQPQLQVPMQPHAHAPQHHMQAPPPQRQLPAQAVAAPLPARRGVPVA